MSGTTRWNAGVIKQLRLRRFIANAWVDTSRYKGSKMIVDIRPNRTLRVTYPNGRCFVHKNLTLSDAREIIDAVFCADSAGQDYSELRLR